MRAKVSVSSFFVVVFGCQSGYWGDSRTLQVERGCGLRLSCRDLYGCKQDDDALDES